MEKILLFQCPEAAKIKRLAGAMKISAREVGALEYKRTLHELYQDRGDSLGGYEEYHGEVPEGSLIVLCQIPEKKFDKLLAQIRRNQITVTYKAALTPTNSRWNVLRVYAEMEREYRAYQQMNANQER